MRPFAGAPSIRISQSLSDVLESLDSALFVSGFARKDRYVLLGDFSYTSSSRSGIALVPGVGPAPASGRLKQSSLTLAAGYRVVEGPDVNVDVFGGLRGWSASGAVNVAGGALTRSSGQTFIDPILAARASVTFSQRWSGTFYADFGGFSVGSKQTWQMLGTANRRLRDQLYLSAGYRHLKVDYRDSGTAIDMSMSGPMFGVTWRF